MESMVWFTLVHALSVEALPRPRPANLPGEPSDTPHDNSNRTITTGERPSDRTIFTVLSLFIMMVLSLLLGSRFSRLRRNVVMRRNITSALVLVMYFFVMSFIICSAVMLTGQGLYTYTLCLGATWICLILYTLSKLTIYIFLVERVHVVRAPFIPRNRDWIYLVCLILVVLSFVAVAINTYLSPIVEIKQSDGRCHMGIPGKASIPFMSVDILVDISLTSIFFCLLRPVVKVYGISKVSTIIGIGGLRRERMTAEERNITVVQKNMRLLLRKSLIGSILIMVPTIANMVQFYVTKGRELALVCLTICVLDVGWDAIVIHWLTFRSAEAERILSRSTFRSQRATLTNETSESSRESREQEAQRAALSLLGEPLSIPPSVHSPNTPSKVPVDLPPKAESMETVLAEKSK